MAPQRTGNPKQVAVLVRQNPQRLFLLLLCSLGMISCADALPSTQGVLPKSRLRLYNIEATTTKTLSAQFNLPSGTANNPYSGSIVAYGGVAPYRYVVSAGSLPSGLSLDPTTGTVSGTPILAGTNNFKFTVTDATGASFHNHAQIVIGTTSTALTAITVSVTPTSATLVSGGSQQFSATVQGTSNTAVAWSASAGTITSGGLFAAPAVSSTTNVTVIATSAANGAQTSALVSVSPSNLVTVAVSPNTASVASGGSQQFNASVQGTSNTAVSWYATSGTISNTGLFTAPVVSTNTSVIVSAVSAVNSSAAGNANVTVSAPTTTTPPLTITTSSLPSGTVGSAYSATLSASGGSSPYRWSGSGIPSGLSLSSSGVLSGTPAASGTFTASLQAWDNSNNSTSTSLPLAITSVAGSPTSDGPAQLPKVSVPHTFPVQGSANVYTVSAGSASDLQSKINTAAANCGSTGALVNVPAGYAYTTSTYFNLPATNCDSSHWVVIQSASLASLPGQGTRISASNVNMPRLSTSAPTSYPVIVAPDNPANPPKGYWLAGLEITDDVSSSQLALVVLGDYCNMIGGGGCPVTSSMTAANLASRFTIDRCWIHGASVNSQIRHGIRFTASQLAIEDSIITEIHVSGADSTGISSDFSMGPIDIGNSEVAAISENILFGGTDPTIAGSVPSDIYIHGNYIHKLSSWTTAGGGPYQSQMKNLIECKNCQRMLVEGNHFDLNIDNGAYSAFHMTPRNAGCRAPWSTVMDVTLRYNHFSNIENFSDIIGVNRSPLASGGYCTLGSLPAKRLSYHDNLLENVDGYIVRLHIGDGTASDCPTSGSGCQLSDVAIVHNSVVGNGSGPSGDINKMLDFVTGVGVGSTAKGYNLVVENNIFPAGSYPVTNDTATSTSPWSNTLNAYFSGWTFVDNAISNLSGTGYSASDVPSDNFNSNLPVSMSNVGFVNWNFGLDGDYRLCHGVGNPSNACVSASSYMNSGSDGTDVGANITALSSAMGQ